jgi:DNA polymerase III subunit epsilon
MSLAAYDIETTGTDTEIARIVQAAIVVSVPGEEYEIFSWLVNPQCEIPLEASAVHGISTEHAQTHGMEPVSALKELLAAFRDLKERGIDAVCAYNSAFDFTILDREMTRHGLGRLSMTSDIGLPIIDPMICDRKLDPYRRGRRTLTAVSSAYGVVVNQAHGDCVTTIKLTRALALKYPRLGRADLTRLQTLQAEAHAESAKHLQAYKRQEDPDFTCNGDWPMRRVELPRGHYKLRMAIQISMPEQRH